MRRMLDICHNCRMCVGYCGTFPDVFARVDRDIEKHDAAGAEMLAADDFTSATDLCWQCKLCYVKCPYTRGRGARVDGRHPAGSSCARRRSARGATASPCKTACSASRSCSGRMTAGPMARVANFVNANRLVRKAAEVTAGIAAEFPLPPFGETGLRDVARAARRRSPGAGSRGTVAVFATCLARLQLPAHRGLGRPRAREERVGRGPARADLLRDAEPRRRRRRRGSRQGARQRRGARRRGPAGAARSSRSSRRAGTWSARSGPSSSARPRRRRSRRPRSTSWSCSSSTGATRRSSRDYGEGRGQGRVPRRLSPARAEDRLPRRARARHAAGHGGRGRRAVLGGRRHVGNEGAVLRDGAPLRAEADARHRRRSSRRSSRPTAPWRRAASWPRTASRRSTRSRCMAEAYGVAPDVP